MISDCLVWVQRASQSRVHTSIRVWNRKNLRWICFNLPHHLHGHTPDKDTWYKGDVYTDILSRWEFTHTSRTGINRDIGSSTKSSILRYRLFTLDVDSDDEGMNNGVRPLELLVVSMGPCVSMMLCLTPFSSVVFVIVVTIKSLRSCSQIRLWPSFRRSQCSITLLPQLQLKVRIEGPNFEVQTSGAHVLRKRPEKRYVVIV